jgi:serine/threonine-protein kinase
VALTAQSDRHTTNSWADVGLESRDLDMLQVTDFEVIDHGDDIPVTYECMRTPVTD